MRLRSFFFRFFEWWLGFRWISATAGALLIGFGFSRYYWEDVYVTQGSLFSYASTLSIVFGGIIVLPLILRAIRWDGFWWVSGAVVLLALGIGLSWFFWDDLHDKEEPLIVTIRNLSLVIGGFIAMELPIWRSIVGERQTAVAQQQAETAQQGLLNERFQKGAEMLGSENLSVRLGGIYALQHLAEEHSEIYHVQVMELLCAFVRHPTKGKSDGAELDEEEQSPRADVSTIAEFVRKRNSAHIQIERRAKFRLDLRNADLRRLNLNDSDLSEAFLFGSDLSRAWLMRANLSNAQLQGALFSELGSETKGTSYQENFHAKISYAHLDDANISGAVFSSNGVNPALGVLQEEVDMACADPENGPDFRGVRDAKTGKPISWHGKLCEDA